MAERPIKKSDREKVSPEPTGRGKGKGKGKGKDKREHRSAPPVNPALVRGPRPGRPKPPVIEEPTEEPEALTSTDAIAAEATEEADKTPPEPTETPEASQT